MSDTRQLEIKVMELESLVASLLVMVESLQKQINDKCEK